MSNEINGCLIFLRLQKKSIYDILLLMEKKMPTKDFIEDLCAEFVSDVKKRNQTAKVYFNLRLAYWKNKSLEMMINRLEYIFAENKTYRQPRKLTSFNDFSLFMQTVPEQAMAFDETAAFHPEFKKLREEYYKQAELTDNPDKLQQEYLININRLFVRTYTPEQQMAMKGKYLGHIIAKRETENFVRKQVAQDFAPFVFDGKRDNGNCTKAIVASLYNIQKKYGIQLFPEDVDTEITAHPKDFANYMAPYMTRSPNGFVWEINDVKPGDIILAIRENGDAGHAMLCYGYDKSDEPLLLGFTPVQTKAKANARWRKGVRIDIKSFITDKVKAHEKFLAHRKLITDKQCQK